MLLSVLVGEEGKSFCYYPKKSYLHFRTISSDIATYIYYVFALVQRNYLNCPARAVYAFAMLNLSPLPIWNM